MCCGTSPQLFARKNVDEGMLWMLWMFRECLTPDYSTLERQKQCCWFAKECSQDTVCVSPGPPPSPPSPVPPGCSCWATQTANLTMLWSAFEKPPMWDLAIFSCNLNERKTTETDPQKGARTAWNRRVCCPCVDCLVAAVHVVAIPGSMERTLPAPPS